jgi:mono/diheme cytochrome c family protein
MKRFLNGIYLLVLMVPMLTGCRAEGLESAPSVIDAKSTLHQEQVERGKHLVLITGCNDCHTPLKMTPQGPAPDMTRMLSGHPESLKMPAPPALPEGPWAWIGGGTNTAFAGPWGVSYAFNLTPDQNTGLGIWTEDLFIKTMRTGRHMGTSRPIKPPMPWQNLSNMSDDDLKAVFAYLQSIPPVSNHVPTALDPEEVSTLKSR